MKVFISWSGDRSKQLAEYLARWLRKMPLAIEPWVSKEAIDPGTRWGKELAEALEGTSFGILCTTPENQREPWINFEAGALSKTIEKSYVIPYVIGMPLSQLEQPLKQFQAIEANKEGTWKLIETIYMATGDRTRTINDLTETFEVWWQELSTEIENINSIENIENKEANMPSNFDIQKSLEKITTVLESLSSRFTRMESERFSLGIEGGIIRSSINQQRRLRDALISSKDISLRDIAIDKELLDFATDPKIRHKMIKILTKIYNERIDESSDENNESKD